MSQNYQQLSLLQEFGEENAVKGFQTTIEMKLLRKIRGLIQLIKIKKHEFVSSKHRITAFPAKINTIIIAGNKTTVT